jgi:hypothetical protein
MGQSSEYVLKLCDYWLTAHKLFPQSWPIRLFLATVVVETIVDLAIQGDIYARLSHISTDDSTEKSVRKMVFYLGLFAFAQSVSIHLGRNACGPSNTLCLLICLFLSVFQLVIAIEAVWQKNTLQFLFLTCALFPSKYRLIRLTAYLLDFSICFSLCTP